MMDCISKGRRDRQHWMGGKENLGPDFVLSSPDALFDQCSDGGYFDGVWKVTY